jgi:hypothetical protein
MKDEILKRLEQQDKVIEQLIAKLASYNEEEEEVVEDVEVIEEEDETLEMQEPEVIEEEVESNDLEEKPVSREEFNELLVLVADLVNKIESKPMEESESESVMLSKQRTPRQEWIKNVYKLRA